MKVNHKPWAASAPWAVLWVLFVGILFYTAEGRELANQTISVPLAFDGVLAARYLNAMQAGLLALRAFRCGKATDGGAAIFFATILIGNGAGQQAQELPLTLGVVLFTLANMAVLWRWDVALDKREDS